MPSRQSLRTREDVVSRSPISGAPSFNRNRTKRRRQISVGGETPTLDGFAVEAARAAVRGSRSLVGRLALVWVSIRLSIEEKLEPIFEESQELLVRVVPQAAAFV